MWTIYSSPPCSFQRTRWFLPWLDDGPRSPQRPHDSFQVAPALNPVLSSSIALCLERCHHYWSKIIWFLSTVMCDYFHLSELVLERFYTDSTFFDGSFDT
jgi:hypothetical protein